MRRLGLPVAAALLGLSAAIVLVGAAVDINSRATSPETLARAYFAALEAADVDGALQAIAPATRERWIPFVENSVGNEYRVTGIAVQYPSILSRLAGQTAGPRDVTIFLDITQAVDGARWQATPRVALVQDGDRWYLDRPPLAPE